MFSESNSNKEDNMDPFDTTNALKVTAYHMEEIAHGLRSGELDPDDAVGLLDDEARAARRHLADLEIGH